MKTIRLAQKRDIEEISGIYDRIHDEIEAGNLQISDSIQHIQHIRNW